MIKRDELKLEYQNHQFYEYVNSIFDYDILDTSIRETSEVLRKKTHKLFYSEFENQLFETIMFLSMKTLVLDINHFSKEIENKSEAYEQYIQQIREENGINHFFDRYPYLLKQINKEVGLIEESYSLLFDRFLEDLSEIRSCFNISEPLSNVAFSLGDSHSKKQTVVKIAFKEKSVYYKPKSYHSHSILLELTSLLKSSNIPSFSLPKSLVKADYCWQLGVAYTSSNKDEVAKIYFKYGVLAAFSEIFSITDLHMENVIVSGGDLYLIDVETFFQRKLNVQNQNFEGITVDTYQRIYETSLSNGLFPVQFEKDSAPNVSGISGKGGKRKKGKYELINKNRGDMKLVKVDYFQEDGFNIPTLNGKVVEPLDYANEIISGFRECYIFLLSQRSKIKGIVEGFPELKSRALFRNTSDYGKFLQASTNPKYLFSEKKRKNLFSILYDAKYIERFIVDNEIKDLMNGDIPYFSMDTRGNVYNSVGTLIGNLGDTTSLFDSITILNDERLKFTCELLEIVLKKPIKHWEREKGKSYQFLSISSEHNFSEEILDSIRQIFIDADKNSFSSEEEITWLNIDITETEQWVISPQNITFSKIDKTDFRNISAFVSQDSPMFDGDVMYNISLGRESVSGEQVIETCKRVSIYDDIRSMPMKFHTPLFRDNPSLSGGQKQRISLARELVTTPRILVLDEPTSALDVKTERIIQKNVEALHCTRILVTHRLNTVEKADKILIMDNGKIIDYGNHHYLYKNNKDYCDLYDSYMNKYQEEEVK
ncbi:TPA: type 2 lanthipeptide synthetase LanM [Streptococcus pyogenes]|uniref:type 2 lanthipeptide synthetase LanM n=2 Tax=Streptococcus pyogenes TaxID=1314 RepID=UPI0002E94E7E|nr:type 2 lanthipeptide synthetase LanM [Streptococcus pyogenes]HER4661451.1 type 2 lantipeptide synthetase LanM [Streptococcus pyogenes NGAS428]HER4780587.1 type 2 lantipeptide synthetase LanM [Streptococcus pyogenes NGAS148]NSX75471.1 type 2 lantipeptide synthetase LanM [Streptococcus pyogenes]NSX78929.1 type 2 lantipeptide synthetase LanM [Streptococcus pyogenes]NTS61616.1 type 2 lantipeptide synthetase LanM [Streptococcus pyogenes]